MFATDRGYIPISNPGGGVETKSVPSPRVNDVLHSPKIYFPGKFRHGSTTVDITSDNHISHVMTGLNDRTDKRFTVGPRNRAWADREVLSYRQD